MRNIMHSFNVDIAKEYGILESILLNNIYFWVEKNKANGMNFYDGKYWTYNSVRAFNELFPYATPKKIRNTLERLHNYGLIETGNYNSSSYDRTLWYSLTEKGLSLFDNSILQNGEIHLPKSENGKSQKGEPIPDNKPYINTDINTYINTSKDILSGSDEPDSTPKQENKKIKSDKRKAIEEIIDYLNERTGSRYKYTESNTKYISARLEEKFTVQDFKTVIDKKCVEWMGDQEMQKYLRPSTLFAGKFESYLNQKSVKPQSTGNIFLDALKRGDYDESGNNENSSGSESELF